MSREGTAPPAGSAPVRVMAGESEPRPADTQHDGDAAGPHPAPPTAVRGERLISAVDRTLGALDTLLSRYLPNDLNPLAQAGRACNFSILVAVASGVLLLIWYSPSLDLAYRSVAAMQGATLGGFVRTLHRYSSDLVMFFALLHAARMFFARKFVGARWLPWVSGMGLLAVMWFIGWTGYWLIWDQPAQQVAVTSMRLLDAVPIFGEPMGRLYVTDRMVPSLLFFVVFFTHMLLPLGIAVGLAVHLLRVNRIQLLPDWRMAGGVLVGLVLASLLVPAQTEAPAAMTVKAAAFTVDAWYLSPLALTLRFSHGGPWLALAAGLLATMALPWLLARHRRPEVFQTRVDTSRCHACSQCVQDCPFDAVQLVPRTDGKRFASEAWVDPARCVGCGVCVGSCDSEAMSLGWFDTRREEARIEAAVTDRLSSRSHVAFVAGDVDSGFGLYRARLWRERLPDYQVHLVPTASWVRPKFLERLFGAGVCGILIVRDAKAEAAARDGNRWIEARLNGARHPIFRPVRAGGRQNWRILDFDASRQSAFVAHAHRFATGSMAGQTGDPVPAWQRLLAVLALGGALTAVTVGLSHLPVANPAPAAPEFVFSFKALGELASPEAASVEADADRPVHMRGRPTGKPHRMPVRVRLSVNGVAQEKSYEGKGLSRDGPALDQWRELLPPGRNQISVELASGPLSAPLRWSGEIIAEPRRIHVLTYEPQSGFRLERD